MVVPDFGMICEIMLMSEGFIDARLLARKFITLYTLCRELLSKQVTTKYEDIISKFSRSIYSMESISLELHDEALCSFWLRSFDETEF